MRSIISRSLFFTILACIATSATAQSMQVIGGSASATNCYMAATIASQTRAATRNDVSECTYALENTSLRYRDRLATYINRGILYVALEDFDRAVRDYDRAYRMDPDVAELHVNRGNMYFFGKVYDQAITEYSAAIEMEFNKQHIALFNRGLAYEKLGELDKAAADYRRALELVPEWRQPQDKLNRVLEKSRGRENT